MVIISWRSSGAAQTGADQAVPAFRDLKLDNTLLDSSRPQRIKLCDFGFAKAWDAGSKNMFTHIGCAAGTRPPSPWHNFATVYAFPRLRHDARPPQHLQCVLQAAMPEA